MAIFFNLLYSFKVTNCSESDTLGQTCPREADIWSGRVIRFLCQIIHGPCMKIIIIEASLSTAADSLLCIVIHTPDLALICVLLKIQVTRNSVFACVIFCAVQQTLRCRKALSHSHSLGDWKTYVAPILERLVSLYFKP